MPRPFLRAACPGGRIPPNSAGPMAPKCSPSAQVVPGPKGLCVLCPLRSPQPSGLEHSALTWPAADVAAAFVITASFCFFFFYLFCPFPLLFWAGSALPPPSPPKPETETCWLMHPSQAPTAATPLAHGTPRSLPGRGWGDLKPFSVSLPVPEQLPTPPAGLVGQELQTDLSGSAGRLGAFSSCKGGGVAAGGGEDGL